MTFNIHWEFFIDNLEKCSKSESGGTPGDGDGTKGSCDTGQYCYAKSVCSSKCTKSESGGAPGDGDGSSRGNCEGTNEICLRDGSCKGIYYY